MAPKHFLIPSAATGAIEYWCTTAYVCLLILVSTLPGNLSQSTIIGRFYVLTAPQLQNLLHVPAYAVLTFLLCRLLCGSNLRSTGGLLAAMFGATLFGMFMEGIQLFIPGRYPGTTDALLNGVGASIGSLTYYRALKASDDNT